MRPNFHDDPDARQKTEAFEVGVRVKVVSSLVDFYAFRGDTGTVIENSGRYLGITVRFDEPRRFKDGGVQEQFNFNYYDLEVLPPEDNTYELRRQLVEAQGEIDKRDKWALDVLKTPILTGIDLPELLRDIDFYKSETHRLLVDNAKMRFYIVELENASRTIDMLLAQQTAREKYEAAFGDQADEGRPIAVDRPPTINACQLPEGHDGPHECICLACNGTGKLDNTPVYLRCPLCYGSGKTA